MWVRFDRSRMVAVFGAILLIGTLVSLAEAASICGVEFMPCEPTAASGIETCCEGFTCVLTTDYVPPVSNVDFKWPGRCLSDRSKELNLLPENFKRHMIVETYNLQEVVLSGDWKTLEDRLYTLRLFLEKGEFAQMIYRLEKKFNIDIPIPDEVPEVQEEEEEEEYEVVTPDL
jgi:hypothetical protein